VKLRRDDEFTSGTDTCAAWVYSPSGSAAGAGPHPAVVMGHGFAGVRSAGLEAYAERFAAAGFSVVVFDYRHFGDSSGEPRELLDIDRQLEDWRNALRFTRGLDEVDPARVAVWGTSFGGGHVLRIAAEDRELAAAISQVPFVDGRASARPAHPLSVLGLMGMAFADVAAAAVGRGPVYVPVIGAPGTVAVLTSPDSESGYRALLPDGVRWPNRVAARIVLSVLGAHPGAVASEIQCPLLVCVADHDALAPAGPAISAARRAPRGELVRYDLGHFDVYVGEPFEQAVADQLDFLQRHV